MPEYLSPGVYVEEVPPRLRAIEGVSTSTTGFVGVAERGPVAGFALPFASAPTFPLKPERGLVLVTSFAEFARTFGQPLPLPEDGDETEDRLFLGHAARAFFDNGGKRLFVARVVGATAARAERKLNQGVRLRLTAPAKKGDTELALNSLRGVNVGDALYVRRASDDADAFLTPAGPAIISGTAVGPFALAAGDRFTVTVNGAATPVGMTAAVAATPAEVTATLSAPLPSGAQLTVRVGQTPQQTFTAASPLTTAADLAAALNAQLTGIQAVVASATAVTLRTDVKGTGAGMEIVGPAATLAALGLTAAVNPGGGNVKDLTAVEAAEIAALFPASSGFRVEADAAGRLRVVSTAVGTAATLQATDVAAGTLSRLGLGTAVQTGTGTSSAATALTVLEMFADRKAVRVAALTNAEPLKPEEVYVVTPVAAGTDGPQFVARSPGAWGDRVSVLIRPVERPRVRVTADVPGTATALQVASATSFYRGAVVEVDRNGQRTIHLVTEVTGTTLTLAAAVGTPVLTAAPAHVRALEIDVVVTDESGTAPTETYSGLTWVQGTGADLDRHYANVINRRSRLVYVRPPGIAALPGTEGPTLAAQPTTANGFPIRLAGGAGGLPAKGAAGDAVFRGADGGPGARTGIHALRDTDEVRIVAVPGKTTYAVHSDLITQCEQLRYRFAVLDGENAAQATVPDILAHRDIYDTSYAAYYTPWVDVPAGDRAVRLPPSGFVAGVYARTDVERGVHKAPANEIVRGAVGLALAITTGEQDVLNPRGVNAIRRFEGRGIRVWGARTLSSDSAVKYVNVRRSLIFLGASIERAMQTVVFDPNAPDTWGRVTDSVRAFLHTQWRNGLLFGRRPEDAFYAVCDESTMTADDVQNGRLICEIGVAIVRPAEFVIFRIEQLTGFAKAT